jgi:hypothetical protein
MLGCVLYWLMIDHITFTTDLMAAETRRRSMLHREAERTATKVEWRQWLLLQTLLSSIITSNSLE